MKENVQSVAAVVVTFNRLELLKKCIQALRDQTKKIDEIIVINNSSTDDTLEWLNSQSDLFVITQENSGSAGGQYTGIKTAYEKSYDWIWCMDDDSRPELDALEMLMPFTSSDRILALCGMAYDDKNSLLEFHRGFFDFNKIPSMILQMALSEKKIVNKDSLQIDFCSFVGLMLSRKAVQKAGYPRKEFFIHHDDVEYCIRLKRYGDILLVPSSKIFHEESTNKLYSINKRFLHKVTYRMPLEKSWIIYFSMRNYVWLALKYVTPKSKAYVGIFLDYIKIGRRIILYDNKKIRRLNLMISSLLDGIKGDFSRNKADIISDHSLNN